MTAKRVKLEKVQTNLDRQTITNLEYDAGVMGVSVASVIRTIVLAHYREGKAIIHDKVGAIERKKPTRCPACGAEKDEFDNPALLFSGKNKWQCYVCNGKGTY